MILRRLLAKIFGYKIVWILWWDGRVTPRLVKPTPFGMVGWVYRITRVGAFTCLPDGKIGGRPYLISWKYD